MLNTKSDMHADRIIKALAGLCFILIAAALLVIRDSPATGYESSIYANTPPLAWALLIFSIACGIGICVHQVYHEDGRGNLWLVGFSLIISGIIVILSLHIIRGYALWAGSGDAAWHLGAIQDINTSGNVQGGNFYPVTHVYLAQLSQIGDINPVVLLKWMPVFFALFYMVVIYFLSKSLLPHKGQVILATVAGAAPLHGWYLNLAPNVLANLAFPLALYLLVRSFMPGTLPWKVLFLIIVFLFPAFHPIPAFVLIAILLALSVPRRRITAAKKSGQSANAGFRFNTSASLLLLVWSVAWLSSFGIWDAMVNNVYSLATEGGPTALGRLVGEAEHATAYGYSVAGHFFKMYGGIVMYFLLALAAFPLLRKKAEGGIRNTSALYSALALLALAIIGLYFLNLDFDPSRLHIYIVLISVILVGFILFQFMKWAARRSWARMAPFLVGVLLVGVSLNGVSYLYPSPYTLAVNAQTTQAEIKGMDWFLHNKDTTIYSSGWYYAPWNYAEFLLSSEERSQRTDLSPYVTTAFPDHLGYDKNPMLGQSYGEDVYLVLTELNRRVYIDVYPKMAEIRLLPGDFAKLEHDLSVDKLYSNGGLDVWYVHTKDVETPSNS